MKLKYILLSSLILLSGCKDPRYGDLYIKDNINLYMREDKTFYLEKDNEKFRGTFNEYLVSYSGITFPYDNEYILSFEKEKIYSYVMNISFLYLSDVTYSGFFEDLDLLLDSIINKDIELDVKKNFDVMYNIESFDEPENTNMTLRLSLYSKDINECKELFIYYIDKIKGGILSDERFNKYTNTSFFENDFNELEPTLTNNEIWVKLEENTFIYKGVL